MSAITKRTSVIATVDAIGRRDFLRRTTIGTASLGALLPGAGRAVASGRQQSLSDHINREEVIEFAKGLCRIPSFTTEESQAAEYVCSFLRREGFECRLQEVDRGRYQAIARLPGSGGGRSLMFNGHLDIDPVPADVGRNPFMPVVEGDRLFGAGLGNMKGGVTAMVMAAVAAKRAGLRLRGDVIIAGVAGELQGGVGTVRMLKSGVRSDMAIVAEPYGINQIVTKHTGVIQLAVHVFGRSAHISRKREGVNAILKAAKIVDALENVQLTGERDPELPALPLANVGTIVGGRGRLPGAVPTEIRGPNNVPDFCTVFVDIRFPESMTPETIRADVHRTLEAHAADDPDVRYEIEFPMKPEWRCLREVMLPFNISQTHPLVLTLRKNVSEVTGQEPVVGPVLPSSYAGNDTSHLLGAGIPCCLYGPGSEDYLSGSISQIITCIRVFLRMIGDVCA